MASRRQIRAAHSGFGLRLRSIAHAARLYELRGDRPRASRYYDELNELTYDIENSNEADWWKKEQIQWIVKGLEAAEDQYRVFGKTRGIGTRAPRLSTRRDPQSNDYVVINYHDVGSRILRGPIRVRSATEAIEKASETPHSSIEVHDPNGWVLQTLIFSPKHPIDENTINKLLMRTSRIWR